MVKKKIGRPRKTAKAAPEPTVVKTTKTVKKSDKTDRYLRNRGNHATVYKPSYPNLVQTLMASGYTQYDVAQDLGVSEQTLYNWAKEYPEFSRALKAGGEAADNRVELSLLSKATGHKWTEEVRSKTINDVGEEVEEVTEITKQIPPDNSAIFFWLKNRRAHRWKDKHEVTHNHTVNIASTQELNLLISQSMIDDAEYSVVDPLKELENRDTDL